MGLQEDFLATLSNGLRRKSIVSCSRWAEEYRILKNHKWCFDEFPWTREPHDCKNEFIIIQKAAQMGFTEVALNLTFYKIDICHEDCLYVLPTESDASAFSSGRFDTALAECEHLQKLFSDANNISLKRAGNSTLYVRGSKSRSKLKSIPTGHITLDEVEEMCQENIPLAFHRSSGQKNPQKLLISTPILHKKGINSYYLDSTQDDFFFTCPCCSKKICFKFPESIVITGNGLNDPDLKKSHYICYECKNVITHENKPEYLKSGRYVSAYPGRDMRGFTVTQLNHMRHVGEPVNIAKAYIKSLEDPTEEQEFYNSTLGQPHIVANSQLTEGIVEDCKKPYAKPEKARSPIVTIGIDVGKYFHFEVDEYYIDSKSTEELLNERTIARVLDEDLIPLEGGEASLIKLIRKWKPAGVVIDVQPEMLLARSLSRRFKGIVYACKFVSTVGAKHIQFNEEERRINVDRTSWLDLALKRFRKRTIQLPTNIDSDYIKHMVKLVRVYTKDADGNPVGRYESTDATDHFAFARVYSEIALGIAGKNRKIQSITGAVL